MFALIPVSGVISRERSSDITYITLLRPALASCNSFCILMAIGVDLCEKHCSQTVLHNTGFVVNECRCAHVLNITQSTVFHIMLHMMSPLLMHGHGIAGLPIEPVLTYSRSFITEICCISQSCRAMAVTMAMHKLGSLVLDHHTRRARRLVVEHRSG